MFTDMNTDEVGYISSFFEQIVLIIIFVNAFCYFVTPNDG